MKDCFIICPLGSEKSDIRKKSDTLLKHVFQPVLDSNDYKAIRADQIPKVGMITSQIINLIIESPLVIADLTDSNPNVFYELAIRHATRKPYIQVIEKGQKIPFDISGIRTIEIDIKDLDSVENAKKEIENHILEFQKGHKSDSPISIASTSRLLQDDSDLADEIAERLSYLGSRDYGYSYDDYEKIDEILRKLYGFNEFSMVSLEDLERKIDLILTRLDDLEKRR